jgi:DNA-directed RNA polymerase subunit M/transcription elongation factor TFIIS
MYYLKISDVEGEISNTLIYYCRNCGHEDATIGEESICVSDIQLKRSEQKYTNMVNEYTKYDPTLPRINTIKCPNQDCASNTMSGGAGSGTGSSKKAATAKSLQKYVDSANKSAAEALASAKAAEVIEKEIEKQEQEDLAENEVMDSNNTNSKTNREVIYIRYDDINMKYVYVCVHCNTTWKTDNS